MNVKIFVISFLLSSATILPAVSYYANLPSRRDVMLFTEKLVYKPTKYVLEKNSQNTTNTNIISVPEIIIKAMTKQPAKPETIQAKDCHFHEMEQGNGKVLVCE